MKKRESRERRVNCIAKKLARRVEKQRDKSSERKKPMKRKETNSRLRGMIAYDLETTNIKAGTPTPLYITAYGENFQLSQRVSNMKTLAYVLTTSLLTEENNRVRFVAWNGNNYDVYFIARALLDDKAYIIRPYLTRSKSLRGLKIISVENKRIYWEFLDGIAMTGLVGRNLDFFLKTFAPSYQKLDAPNWETETFNADNVKHVEYAERDSEGLYHAMKAAQDITLEHIGIALQPTIGNLGVKAFMRNMPHEIQVWGAPLRVVDAIRNQAMRGGYCHCVKRFHGPIWKYDLNQAYAAAMRDTPLPCGRVHHVIDGIDPDRPGIVRLTAKKRGNKVPFYYRQMDGLSAFANDEITDTWLTTLEYQQLIAENWKTEISESYFWDESFTMRDYVYKLETVRINAPDGVNGATGLMMKAIGNNSYGKTVETLDGLELIMSLEKPEEFSEYQTESDELQFVWFRFCEPLLREYHQPQIGAMITAHVRMVVRRAALLNPGAWLYADTDCVIFSEAVDLKTHPKLYGRWKEECAGESYYIIEKKVYSHEDVKMREQLIRDNYKDDKPKHSKGMNVKKLAKEDFVNWFDGKPPKQSQVHKNNFVKFVTGAAMFHDHEKVGQVLTRQ